jgi:hypothetical protein
MTRYRADARVARPGESAHVIEHEARRRYDTDATLRQMADYGGQPYGWVRAHHLARKQGQDIDSGTDGDDDDHRNRDDDDDDEPSMYRPSPGGREIIVGDGDRADSIGNDNYRRGYRYERRKHPDWSHEQLLTYVDRRLMGDRYAYEPSRIEEEMRRSRYAKAPGSSDSCKSCRHYVPYLDDNRAGVCSHSAHHGKQVLCDQICRHWER